MRILTFVLFACILLSACQTDQRMQDQFAGTFEITLAAPDANSGLAKEKSETKQQLKEELDRTGDDAKVKNALDSFEEEVEQRMAVSIGELKESLGTLGITLGTSIVQIIQFEATFNKDGSILIGQKKRISFENEDLHWKIKDGDVLIWNDNVQTEEEARTFTMEKKAGDQWDLVSNKLTFHLKRKE